MDKKPAPELSRWGKIICGTILFIVVVPPVVVGMAKLCVWLWSL